MNKRPDRHVPEIAGPAVHSLDHFVMSVPDLDAAARFYATFGLDVRREDEESLDLYCHGWPHRAVTIRRGPAKRLIELVFGAYEQDLAAFRERLEHLAVPCLQVDNSSLSFADLDGTAIRIIGGGEKLAGPEVAALQPP